MARGFLWNDEYGRSSVLDFRCHERFPASESRSLRWECGWVFPRFLASRQFTGAMGAVALGAVLRCGDRFRDGNGFPFLPGSIAGPHCQERFEFGIGEV